MYFHLRLDRSALVICLTGLLILNILAGIEMFSVRAQGTMVGFFLHGSGSNENPLTLFLDNNPPTATTAKYKDSPSIKFGGGNPWKEIGTWTASPSLTDGRLKALSDLHVWLGLKNSDDQGTNFGLLAGVYKNGILVASGETYLIKGVTRNPSNAKEVTVSFGSFSPVDFGTTDTLSLKMFTGIGTDGNGKFGGGHSSAVGLRLYFDAGSRPAKFDATFNPLVTFTAEGNEGVRTSVTYSVDGGAPTTTAVPFTIDVPKGSTLSYAYATPLLSALGTRYVLTATNPPSPQTVTSKLTVVGTYVKQYQLTLAVYKASVPGGVGNIVGGTNGAFYDADTVLSLTATTPIPDGSDKEWRFDQWSGDATGIANPVSVTMNAPKSITANYLLVLLGNEVTSLGPAYIWVGLKNSDDVGAKFDLRVEVYRDRGGTLTLVGSGDVFQVSGGSSGFNNAIQHTINMALQPGVRFLPSDKLSIKVLVKNSGLGHNFATARLWCDGISTKANSRFAVTIGSAATYYLRSNFALSTTVGTANPGSTIDVATNPNTYVSFGTWSITLS